MKAIIVEQFQKTPSWDVFPEPIPKENELLIRVKTAALSNLVKAIANGSHYSSVATFPFAPGVDGVGQLEDGTRVYFCFPRAPWGAMAEYTVVDKSYCIPLPQQLDDITAASIANPAMSSWGALTYRACIQPGETVLINGASGAAGSLAIKIARHLGAKKIIATARAHHVQRLSQLGADEVISLSTSSEELIDCFHKVFAEHPVSIILDYLWGSSAEALLQAISQAHQTHTLRWIQIGSMGGNTIQLNAFPLRSTGLQLLGSGLGSLSNQQLVQSIAAAFKAAPALGLQIDTEVIPMADAATFWEQATGTKRIVFTLP